MIISLNWLKKFVEIDMPVEDLVTLIGSRLVEVEKVDYIGDKYKDVIVARVADVKKLEGSDHLSVVLIDDGGVNSSVDRNDDGLITVVCGAPNVTADTYVAWLPPETIVPETCGSAEPFVLATKPLRGVVSNGMLASARELDLYDEHEGILIIDKDVSAGDSFRDVYELDDYIIDIENKSLTHRPDAFGIIGFAREVAGIQGKEFETPDWLTVAPGYNVNGGELKVIIEDKSASEYTRAVVLESGADQPKSSVQVQTYLSRSGVRPISTFVDVTNYLMLLTGQPLHAYDYDKFLSVSGGKPEIKVRYARDGEKLNLIDDREVDLSDQDIVIVAGDTPVGLAGAMGGAGTAIDDSTRRVLLEVATFNLYSLRSTQMRHGIFSEAVTRFTKGVPAGLGAYVIAEAVNLLGKRAGTKVVGEFAESGVKTATTNNVEVSLDQVNGILGVNLSSADISEVLENVGFTVEFKDQTADVTVPYWRKDISIPEDVVEEVGRLLGFDNINFTLPKRSSVAVMPEHFENFKQEVRRALVSGGANEVLTYSFVHEDSLSKSGLDPENSYEIVNSISPELQRYRQSLVPSLLGLVHPNIKAGFDSFGLFEINKVHSKDAGLNEESVPVEQQRLGFVVTSSKKTDAPYYLAKRYLDYLANKIGVGFRYVSPDQYSDQSVFRPFEPKRSAAVLDATSGVFIGVVGEFKKSVRNAWKLPNLVSGFEVYLEDLSEVANSSSKSIYSPLSRYPSVDRDICFQVDESVNYQEIIDSAKESLAQTDYSWNISPVDIYSPESLSVKNVTIKIELVSHEKTMTGAEVSEVCDKLISDVLKKTKGRVI